MTAMTTTFRFAAFTALVILSACTGTGGIAVIQDTHDDSGQTPADTRPELELKTEAGGAGELPAAEVDSGTADGVFSCQGTGCPWTECSDNSDCLSGLCMQHMGDTYCSDFCVEDCPDGWSCKQVEGSGSDPVFVCVSDFSHLCLPCGESSDCSSVYNKNACIAYEGVGTFCGGACDAGHPCPEGYSCADAWSTEGSVTKQCVSGSGMCECSKTAVKIGMSTPCAVTNEFGTCGGRRICTEAGLTECDAETPAPEECNGLDDDCNGDADDASCDDGNACTDDQCEPASGCKHAPLDGNACDDQDKCTSGDTCQEGVCTGKGVKCNDGNPCTDDLCDDATGCLFVPNAEPCDDGDPCTIGDHCKGEMCASGPAIKCDDKNACTDDICDGDQGGCLYVPNTGNCDDSNPCTTGDHCSAGKCVFTGSLDCSDGNLCTTDMCDPSSGCTHQDNTLPCDDNSLCTAGDKCFEGACVPGKAVACDDGNPCTDDACNALVGCVHTNNSAQCDDFDPCTVTDSCSGGMCVGTGLKACDDLNPCTNDFCVPMAGCSSKPNSAPCSDGSVCTVADVCTGGSCLPGEPLKCDDGNPCTKDSCDPVKGCVFAAMAGACDDLNACTTDDHCENGKCVSSQPADCDDKNPCTTDLCMPGGGCKSVPNQAPCDDGDPCTAGDVCAAGTCVSGPKVQCDDGNVCTTDVCVQGSCQHSPTEGACDDKNPCTLGDQCKNSLCQGEAPLQCDDANVCTTDYCDPTKGCVHLLNDLPCDDLNLCTTGDHCKDGACTHAGTLSCDDANPCTDDSCLPEQGCLFTANESECDDGNACTVGDKCSKGACVAQSLLLCDDANPCTADSCLPGLGCVNAPTEGPCSDGDVCTLNDLCAVGKCVPGATMNCDDGNPCTADSCDPKTGCSHLPGNDGAKCDDGNACTNNDLCASGKCAGNELVSCDDGNACTSNICDPLAGCKFPSVQDATPCNDGNACTPTDACVAGKCEGSGALQCNDGAVCTTDSCDPLKGCVYTPITPCCGNAKVEAGEECDDGNTNSGDGCSSSCKKESPCPNDVAYVANYCWVRAISLSESHGSACSRIGKAATTKNVNVGGWSDSLLQQVAAKWGFTSAGAYACCAHAMWCNSSSKQCGTHGWGGDFDNYGSYGDNSWWPVYTCKP